MSAAASPFCLACLCSTNAIPGYLFFTKPHLLHILREALASAPRFGFCSSDPSPFADQPPSRTRLLGGGQEKGRRLQNLQPHPPYTLARFTLPGGSCCHARFESSGGLGAHRYPWPLAYLYMLALNPSSLHDGRTPP